MKASATTKRCEHCEHPTPKKKLKPTAFGLRCERCRDAMHRGKRKATREVVL